MFPFVNRTGAQKSTAPARPAKPTGHTAAPSQTMFSFVNRAKPSIKRTRPSQPPARPVKKARHAAAPSQTMFSFVNRAKPSIKRVRPPQPTMRPVKKARRDSLSVDSLRRLRDREILRTFVHGTHFPPEQEALWQKLYTFQSQGVAVMCSRGGCGILSMEMGLGKTITGLATIVFMDLLHTQRLLRKKAVREIVSDVLPSALLRGIEQYAGLEVQTKTAWPLAFICPNSVCGSTKNEAKRWLGMKDEEIEILDGRTMARLHREDKRLDDEKLSLDIEAHQRANPELWAREVEIAERVRSSGLVQTQSATDLACRQSDAAHELRMQNAIQAIRAGAEVANATRPRGIDRNPKKLYIMTYERAVILGKQAHTRTLFARMNSVILDESQKLRSHRTSMARVLGPLIRAIPHRVLLTGTPMDRPRDFFVQLNMVRPDLFGEYSEYAARYCGRKLVKVSATKQVWDDSRASNLDELHDLLDSKIMYRRMKTSPGIMDELSRMRGRSSFHVVRSVKTLDREKLGPGVLDKLDQLNGEMEDIKKEEKERQRAIRKYATSVVASVDEDAVFQNLAKNRVFMEVYRTILKGKRPLLIDYVREELTQFLRDTDRKIVLFVYFKETLKQMCQLMRDMPSYVRKTDAGEVADDRASGARSSGARSSGARSSGARSSGARASDTFDFIAIDGGVASHRRTELVDQFQTDPQCRVAVLTIKACSQGLTLTAGTRVDFLELPMLGSDVEQAEARCVRIGQNRSVDVNYVLVDGTVEENIFKHIIMSKKENIAQVMDKRTTDFNYKVYEWETGKEIPDWKRANWESRQR